jgi:hypothetical protein
MLAQDLVEKVTQWATDLQLLDERMMTSDDQDEHSELLIPV